jgi:hypothetical protein
VVLENSGIWGLLGSCVTLPGTTHAVYTGFEFIVSYINFGLIRDSICSDPGLLYYICTVMCLCKWDSVFLSWVSFCFAFLSTGWWVGRGSWVGLVRRVCWRWDCGKVGRSGAFSSDLGSEHV